ncbi:hypothetical protein LSG31_19575 [Fodinisporobacter ferrooxydans]|uniref:Uncharacterized protein n=1 Tax=Fodinisporobacter ferrooxydans TaxID=2901836 RepID=A0ABY4CHQ1_9BACL|nr:hypothetical protein LSG31_19575 [Alicyclobacillaceae bacterium MYW30-H2]
MPQQINTDQLKQAEAAITLAKELVSQAIQQSASNQQVAQEALKQCSNEIAQAQTTISQVQSAMQTQSAQQTK